MKLVADMHTHSIASTHAYATITEMAQEAHDLGLFAIAVTDHARTMPGAPGPFYFESLAILPAYIKGVRVLHGIEANVEKCTQAYLNLAKNPNVNVIGHSGSEYFKYDYKKVIPQLAKEGKLIEINDSAFRYKKSCASNCVRIAEICKKYGARICVDTDSHYTHTLGRGTETLKILEEIDFPHELIVNADEENLKAYFKEKNIYY